MMRDGVEFSHHRDQLRRSLAGVERDYDYAFGHQGEVKRGPANTVWR